MKLNAHVRYIQSLKRLTVLSRFTIAIAETLHGGEVGETLAQQPVAEHGADLALINATVYTVDDRQPKAEAFAVSQGRFIAVGGTDKVRKLIKRNTQVIDAAGMTVVPGFIDAHTHPADSGVSELPLVNCDRRTIGEIKEAIRTRANETPAGEWILGFKYDDTKLKDDRPLSRADLDEAAPKHPVRVTHRGGHTGVVNSLCWASAK